jgi:hypothetical protein
VYGAVNRDVSWAVNQAVFDTVRRTVIRDVSWAVNQAVSGAVRRTVIRVAAVKEDPPHPAVELYLRAVGVMGNQAVERAVD